MIESARLFSWGGAVPPEVGSARGPFLERRGLLLAVQGSEGRGALGEATPLPGGTDSLELSRAGLEAYPWRAAPVPRSLAELARVMASAGLPPAAAFALDSALASLAAARAGTSRAEWLCGRGPERLPRSVYVGMIGDGATAARALRALGRGARTLKLKAPCRDVEAEARWLVALRREIGPEPRLRLDCNGALSPHAAPQAMRAYAAAGLELVEEPCGYEALLELGALAVPWFADESLARPELRRPLLAHPPLAGVVLKPTSIGGLVASLQLAESALAAGKQVIVTHAFEGPVALAACADLALALGERAQPPGLDLHAGLQGFPGYRVPQLPTDGAFVEPPQARSEADGQGNLPQVPAADLISRSVDPETEVWSWTR